MPYLVRAFITTFRPSKQDEPNLWRPLRPKFSYGVRVYFDGALKGFAASWIESKESTLPEMMGLAALFTSLDEHGVEPSKLELILNSAHLKTRIDQVKNALRKQQQGKTVQTIQNAEQWETTVRHLDLFNWGLREAIGESEEEQIGLIKSHLKNEFYATERFLAKEPPSFELILSDD